MNPPGRIRPSGLEVHSQGRQGCVFGSDISQLDVAARLAHAIDKCFTRVGKKLGYSRVDDLEVWLFPGFYSGLNSRGIATKNYIALKYTPNQSEPIAPVFAHELVHWHAWETPIDRNLPGAIVEGVCDLIVVSLYPEASAGRVQEYEGIIEELRERGELARCIGLLDVPGSQLGKLPEDQSAGMYAIGYALAARIGVDVLLEAAETGPVSPAAILEMAGVEADGTGL